MTVLKTEETQANQRNVSPSRDRSESSSKSIRFWYFGKSILLSSVFISLYCALLFNEFSLQITLAITASLSIFTVSLLASFGHDASHGAFSKSRALNEAGLFVFDFFGVNGLPWRARHILHHRDTNNINADPETSLQPWFRISPYERILPHHRVQLLLVPIAFCLTMIKMQFIDEFNYIFSSDPKNRLRNITRSIFAKTIFFGWALVLPIVFLGFAQGVVAFLSYYCFVGVAIGILIQVAHNVPGTDQHSIPATGKQDWQRRQIETTSNFKTGPLLGTLTGGMDRQIEHHLFPSIPHTELASKERVVRELCDELGVKYKIEKSLGHAFLAHLRHLHALGNQIEPRSNVK